MTAVPRARMLRVATVTLIALFAGGAPIAVAAQQSGTDLLRGTVRDSALAPLANVTVSATSVSTRTTRATQTDSRGRFSLPFPDGGGTYWVRYSAVGYAPLTLTALRSTDEVILLGDVRLARSATPLPEVSVVARRQRVDLGAAADPEAVGGRVAFPATSVASIPLAQLGDLAGMFGVLPGVQLVVGADRQPVGYSVHGLPPEQNSIVLNGAVVSASMLPSRVASRLIMTSYDPSHGGFSGGQTAITTSSGSNIGSRALAFNLQDPRLQWADPAASRLGPRALAAVAEAQIMGPIVPDRLFYNVLASVNLTSSDRQTLLDTDAPGLLRAGIASDSVERFLQLLTTAGVARTATGIPARAQRGNASAIATLNYNPEGAHFFTLTLFGGMGRTAPASGGGFSAEVPAHSGVRSRWNGAVQAKHATYAHEILIETIVTLSGSGSVSTPYLTLPEGRVSVVSALENGTSGISTFAFGGNPSLENDDRSRSAGVLSMLSWYSWNTKHRLRLTAEIRNESSASSATRDRLGSFTYNSLADLAAERPASYTRRFNTSEVSGAQMVTGVSLGDLYRPVERLQIQYGVRVDGQHFSGRPTRNALVQSTFGAPNDWVPNQITLSPRLGFQYALGPVRWYPVGNGSFSSGPRNVIRGGIGDFRGLSPATLLSAARAYTGLVGAAQQIRCTGTAVPSVDWSAPAGDPAGIPASCVGGVGDTLFANSLPSVVMFDRRFSSPHSIRSNLEVAGLLLGRISGSLEVTYSRNLDQPGTTDLNFDPTAEFALGEERGRPVFVAPTSIAQVSGAVASRDGRVSDAFSTVTDHSSRLMSESRQIIVSVAPFHLQPRRFVWTLTYVYQRTRGSESGFDGTTVGNPLEIRTDRGAAPDHSLYFSSVMSVFDRLLTLRINGRAASGSAFTPVVAGDVNGDGSYNDRAFVFDPLTAADPQVAGDMTSLLTSGSPAARRCLQAQVGRIAGRNSCRGPWTMTMFASITVDGYRLRLPWRLSPTITIANPLTGIDALVHGTRGMRGWGGAPVGDPRLLFTRGFDPVRRAYRYDVNGRFGETRYSHGGVAAPLSVTLSLAVDVGPRTEREQFRETLRQGRRREGTGPTEAMLRVALLSSGIGDPLQSVLQDAERLGLSAQQADSLSVLSHAFALASDSIWSPTLRYLETLPPHADLDAAWDRYLQARLRQLELLIRLAPLATTQLSPAQRRALPPYAAAYLDVRGLRRMRASGRLYDAPG